MIILGGIPWSFVAYLLPLREHLKKNDNAAGSTTNIAMAEQVQFADLDVDLTHGRMVYAVDPTNPDFPKTLVSTIYPSVRRNVIVPLPDLEIIVDSRKEEVNALAMLLEQR